MNTNSDRIDPPGADLPGEEPVSQPATLGNEPTRFWRLFGIAVAVDAALALLYTLIVPGFVGNALSDALCMSSVVLGFISIVPVFIDLGRGIALPGVVGGSDATRRAAFRREHERRERGTSTTLALGAAALLIAVVSFVIGLL